MVKIKDNILMRSSVAIRARDILRLKSVGIIGKKLY